MQSAIAMLQPDHSVGGNGYRHTHMCPRIPTHSHTHRVLTLIKNLDKNPNDTFLINGKGNKGQVVAFPVNTGLSI